jgi:hypothetical protein
MLSCPRKKRAAGRIRAFLLLACLSLKEFFKQFSKQSAFLGNKPKNFMRNQRTEVVIETSEIFIIRQRRHFIRAWCEDCQKEVSLISPREAALLTFRETDAIYSLIDENRVHFRLFGEKTPFVCLTSLCLV